MNKIILDLDTKEIYSETKTRCLLLREECRDITNHSVDYITKLMNIDAQLKCIKSVVEEQKIEKIVDRLNELWGYNIKILQEIKESDN